MRVPFGLSCLGGGKAGGINMSTDCRFMYRFYLPTCLTRQHWTYENREYGTRLSTLNLKSQTLFAPANGDYLTITNHCGIFESD